MQSPLHTQAARNEPLNQALEISRHKSQEEVQEPAFFTYSHLCHILSQT